MPPCGASYGLSTQARKPVDRSFAVQRSACVHALVGVRIVIFKNALDDSQ